MEQPNITTEAKDVGAAERLPAPCPTSCYPPLVLSLFPGVGLLDRAFEDEGFAVVRGPDVLWGGDIRKFRAGPGAFAGVIGGPPCQSFTPMNRVFNQTPTMPDLIVEFERVVADVQPAWWAMENVTAAPVPSVDGYQEWSCVLNNRQFGEDQNRVRRWTFGARSRTVLMIETVALECQRFTHAAMTEPGKAERMKTGRKTFQNSEGFAELCRRQGLPDGFDLPPFKIAEKCRAVGNGVPLPMGRAIARAIHEAMYGG